MRAELELWSAKWRGTKDPPATAIEALDQCKSTFSPNIAVLLKIFATLPITTCTAERFFSVLRILKSYLRSTIEEERLTGLTFLYVHSDIVVDIEDVINCFAAKNRR